MSFGLLGDLVALHTRPWWPAPLRRRQVSVEQGSTNNHHSSTHGQSGNHYGSALVPALPSTHPGFPPHQPGMHVPLELHQRVTKAPCDPELSARDAPRSCSPCRTTAGTDTQFDRHVLSVGAISSRWILDMTPSRLSRDDEDAPWIPVIRRRLEPAGFEDAPAHLAPDTAG